MTTPSPALAAELGSASRRPHHPRRRRQDRPDAGAARQARGARQARRRRRALQRARPAREAHRLRHRMHRGRSARPRADRGAAEACQRGVHGRPQVRLVRPRGPDLGDERARAGAGRRGVRGLAHRRLFDRLRLSVRQCAARRRDRGDAGHAAARRLRQFLRRARGHVPVFLAHARHARPHHPAQLRDRHALWRAARRRDPRADRADDRSRHRPRQRDLARRRQRHGAARARPLHGAVEPAQRQRAGDRERALAGAGFRATPRQGAGLRRASRRPRAGWSTPPRRCDCSAIRACRWRRWSIGPPTGSAADCRASARTPTTIRAMATSDPAVGGEIGAVARPSWTTPARWCAKPGWNQIAADWRIFLELGTRLRGADDGRPDRRHHRDLAVRRPLRLDQHGAGGGRLSPPRPWRRR